MTTQKNTQPVVLFKQSKSASVSKLNRSSSKHCTLKSRPQSKSSTRPKSNLRVNVNHKDHISSAFLTQKSTKSVKSQKSQKTEKTLKTETSRKSLRKDRSQKSLKRDRSTKSISNSRKLSRKTSKKRSLSPFRVCNDSRASAEAYTPKVNYSNLHDEPNIDIVDQESLARSSRITQAQFQSVNNKDNQ